VHIFGNVVDIQRLKTVIPSNIPIIEDAAQSHGSRINGIHSGSMGDIGVFSFYPTKNLGGYGDGGVVVTNNSNIAEKIRLMRMYGMIDKDHIVINGINSRLDELQAAILRVKLKCLDDMNELRNKIADAYKNKLDNNYLSCQYIPDNVLCNYHVFAAKVERDRDALMNYLESRRIQTNIYYSIPLHLQEANRYLGYKTGDFPVAEQLCNQVIALPMYPELSEQKLSKIIKAINKFAKKRKI
jgi:dTDP-4-amino-4,6-dideoxygalactose transaminase